MLLTILFYTFFLAVIVQLSFYLILFKKFVGLKQTNKHSVNTPVSVIIAAKNESSQLKRYLPLILQQDYPTFEVILVNDASTDNSETIISDLQKKHKHLKLVSIPLTLSYSGNKKNALSEGIKKASHDHLIFTDADCKPKTLNWISEIMSHFTKTKNIVLGYGAYETIDHSFLNKLIRYETLLTAIQYFSYTIVGLPYMGVGRNLAYSKSLFTNHDGFNSHKHIKSGDDDLLISEIATPNNVNISYHKSSHTLSLSNKSYKNWFRQKRRHISTSTSYKPVHQFLLGLFYSSQFLFWTLAIILLASAFNWQIVTILIFIRLTVHYIIIQSSAKKLDEKNITYVAPILDFLLVFSQFGLVLTNLFSRPKHW